MRPKGPGVECYGKVICLGVRLTKGGLSWLISVVKLIGLRST